MKTSMLVQLLAVSLLLYSCEQYDKDAVEKTILEQENNILKEWGKGNTMIFPQHSAQEITYFDPSLAKRVNGKKEFEDLLKPFEYKFFIQRYEMLEPKVQAYGDVAVLTYNLVDHSTDSLGAEKTFRWNATEVYKRYDDKWLIVHSHWSVTKPEMKQ